MVIVQQRNNFEQKTPMKMIKYCTASEKWKMDAGYATTESLSLLPKETAAFTVFLAPNHNERLKIQRNER